MATKYRTIVLTIAFDDDTVADPVRWILPVLRFGRINYSAVHRWRIIGANTPAIEPTPCDSIGEDVRTVVVPAMPALNPQGGPQ